MAAMPISIASDSTHLDINHIVADMLASHGERVLLDTVAREIGFLHMRRAAAQGEQTSFSCDSPHAVSVASKASCGPAAIVPKAHRVMTYYDAGCPGAKKLARGLDRSIFKKGFTCQEVEANRLDGLDEAAYGGWAANQAALDATKPLEGWNDWTFARHEPTDTAHLTLPDGVIIHGGLWHVFLPEGVAPEDLDRIVTAAMMPRQLAFWAMSGEGRAHCKQHHLDPQQFVRFARDSRTGVLRPVEELYVYSPRRDGGWFAAILADALAKLRAVS